MRGHWRDLGQSREAKVIRVSSLALVKVRLSPPTKTRP